jgi:hypothetical protein
MATAVSYASKPAGGTPDNTDSKTLEHIAACLDVLVQKDPVTKWNDIACTVDGVFSDTLEKEILTGKLSKAGEIPAAISDEEVKRNNLFLAEDERKNTQLLLCKALNSLSVYNSINNSLSVKFAQEGSDLPKTVAELKKMDEAAEKDILAAADLIKKTYNKIQEVCKAVDELKKTYESVCTAQDKQKMKEKNVTFDNIVKISNCLLTECLEAIKVIVQIAAIHALNNLSGFEETLKMVKDYADEFKTNTNSGIESATKKVAEGQKLYNTMIVTVCTKQGEVGKATTLKKAKEKTFCFLKNMPDPHTPCDPSTPKPDVSLEGQYNNGKKAFENSVKIPAPSV